MKQTMILIAAGAALAAAPAMAQLGGLGGSVGGAVNGTVGGTLDPGSTVSQTTDGVGRAVNRADSTVQDKIDHTNLQLATSEQLASGVVVRDSEGKTIGTVQRIEGDTALVVRGNEIYDVPVSQLYAKANGKVKEVMTQMPKASFKARANADADASASGD